MARSGGRAALLSCKHWWIDLVNNSHNLNTPRATSATTGDQTEQHIQAIGTKKYKQGKWKTNFNWLDSKTHKFESR
jgi:hypothetical protein